MRKLKPHALRAMYICRGCGGEIAYPDRFVKCPMCGIKFS